jgi:predicted NACHT family NTPase
VNQEDFKTYLQELVSKLPTVNYIERIFALAKEDGHLSQDFDYFESSLHRDRQPDLVEVLEQKQLLVLAEPGGGKSIVAKAAVREFTQRTATLPVFAELKEYRGKLAELISSATPAWALQADAAVDGQILQRAFVLDGLDEVPVDLQQAFFVELSNLMANDSKNCFFLTSRQAFYVSHRKALPPVSGPDIGKETQAPASMSWG